MSSTHSNSPQYDSGAAINLERGRPADFTDGPLPEDVVPDVDNDTAVQERNAAVSIFIQQMQQHARALPLSDAAWVEPGRSERHAVVFFFAAHRVFEEDSTAAKGPAAEMVRFWDRLMAHLTPWASRIIVRGMPDRDVSVFDLAARIYQEVRDRASWGAVRQGNPFRVRSGPRMLCAALLAYAHAYVRRVVREVQGQDQGRRAFWLHAQALVVVATNTFDEEQAEWFFRII